MSAIRACWRISPFTDSRIPASAIPAASLARIAGAMGAERSKAFAASQGLCRETLISDQLILCSTPGLGKTHLLQAIGRSLTNVANTRSVRVRYLTAEEFATRMVLALKMREMDRFKAEFRDHVDILLLEDIHFLQGKEKIQDELLATLKALREHGSKIVLTSSFLPRELGSGERGDRPGPGVGIGLSWRPSPHWRFGGDLVVRAERVDADNRLYDWTGYFAPGVEFVPNPNAARPLAFGVITPAALRPREEGWAGVFFVIRWMDAGARKPGGVRGGED